MPKQNIATDVFKFIDMTSGKDNCWEWKRKTKGGGRDNRPYFDLNGKKVLAYRLAYQLFKGITLEKEVVLRHKCDNQRCCNPHHLEEGSQADNIQDMIDRERNGLPKSVVKAIRRSAMGDEECAKVYGLTIANVKAIRNNQSYKHIKE